MEEKVPEIGLNIDISKMNIDQSEVFTDSAQPSYDEAIQPTTGKYVIFPTHI